MESSAAVREEALRSALLQTALWKTVCHLPPHSERYNYRVELGKHSLEAAEDGSMALRAAAIISHEDYNILLSR